MYAARLLDLDLPQTDKRVLTFVETDGCFADGVAVATVLRIRPRLDARSRAHAYVPAGPSRWHTYLEAYQCMFTAE